MGQNKAERDAFLKEIRIGTLCTLNPDGSPNALPLWYEWDGEKIRMFTNLGTGKLKRIAADPRACLSVAQPVGVSEAWVTVEGTVEVIEEGGSELGCKLAALYYETELAKRTIAVWEKATDMVLLELTPTRFYS